VDRVESVDPPPSIPAVPAHSPFFVELWASGPGGLGDGLACVYADVHVEPADMLQIVPPAGDSPFFPVNVVPPSFHLAGLVEDAGGCQTIPATPDLGFGEWVLLKRISMAATATLGTATVSVTGGDNPFASPSIIGNINIIGPADIEYGNALVDVICEAGTIPDLASVAAFQNCFAASARREPIEPSCEPFDSDCDLEIDLGDYADLVSSFHGP
jgi:hypothetical protein